MRNKLTQALPSNFCLKYNKLKYISVFTGLVLASAGCAHTPTQAASEPPPPSLTQPNEADVAQETDLQEAPLYTQIFEEVDPAIYTGEEDLYVPPSLSSKPYIKGTLPGQPTLSEEHYREAASPYKQPTVVYASDDAPTDIWERIRLGYKLPTRTHPGMMQDLAWFARHQAYLDRVVERSQPYIHYIVEEAEKRGMPLEIALLPVVESAFQPFAYSHGRAAGIWQFIPGTGRLYGLKQNWWYDGRRDIVAATNAALDYLTRLNRGFDGDWLLALAAYNSGFGTVSRAIYKNKRKGKPTDFWNLDLPNETRGYVPKLLAIAALVEDPEKYNVSFDPIPNEPYFAQVDVGSQIDLALAAELAEISVEDLYILNPGFNRWATDPDGPHTLLFPIENAKTFTENLASLPDDQRVRWVRHQVKKGQTLLHIADNYNTTVDLIRDVNNLRRNALKQGQNLVIPVASKNASQYVLSAEQRLESLQSTQPRGREQVTYYVKEGDTWWSIAQRHKVDYRSLAKWNGLAPRDALQTGKKLVIWAKPGKGRLTQVNFSPLTHSQTTQKIGYHVRRGDSLARIARKFNVTVENLLQWNHRLSKRSVLRRGQKVIVFVDITKQSGA